MLVNKITDLIGNTPMLKIASVVHGLPNINLYAKLEMMNPFGSVKDRIAWAMLKDDLDDIIINNKLIVENSSGNTSKAMQAIAGIYGADFKLMSAIAKVSEPLDVMRILGAEIEELTQAGSDCFDPNDPNDPQYLIEKFIEQSERPVFFTSQFTNQKNVEIHKNTTAPEILNDINRVDWFVGGLGTTGSSRGIIETIKDRDPDMKAIGVCGESGELIPGIRASEQLIEAGFYERKIYDVMISLNAKTAVDSMLELNHKSGILCGPSSGAQYAAIKKYFNENPATKETNVVFLACDRMEWYISYIKKYRPDLFGLEDGKSIMAYYINQEKADQCKVAPDAVIEWINNEQPIIIDTRTPASLKILSFEGAINIPEKTLEEMVEKQQPFPRDKKVLFLCAVGQKSLKMAAYLRDKNVDAYSLEGGVVAYQNFQKQVA